MPSEYIEDLITRGARPVDPKEHEAFLSVVQKETIPAIVEAERRNRIAVHNLRMRAISLPKKGA